MGRTVQNSYENNNRNEITYLQILSLGYYNVIAEVDTSFDDKPIVELLKKYKWCYEQSKGQIFTSDPSGVLPRKMGYSTPKVYLRDYILHLLGYDCHKIEWRRPTIFDYRVKPCDLFQRVKTF